jgi:predicted NUDIX family NTP pyrophosphohydrolase
MPMAKRSAGLLMYRRKGGSTEVLLVHPGRPLWAKKNAVAWSIPNGEYGSATEDATKREITEETGFPSDGIHHSLGEARLQSGKLVTAWAFEGDCDPRAFVSNTFELEWPPRSGQRAQGTLVIGGGLQAIPDLDAESSAVRLGILARGARAASSASGARPRLFALRVDLRRPDRRGDVDVPQGSARTATMK